MPDYPLNNDQCMSLLQNERIARFAFSAEGALYLIPLGYVWFEGALCGMTDAGRKTQMAASQSHVGFQIDDSAKSGPFGWRSVVGEGEFQIITDAITIAQLAPVVFDRFSDAPSWALSDLGAKAEQGKAVYFKVSPSMIAGRAFTEYAPE